jgi:hypothetical protein
MEGKPRSLRNSLKITAPVNRFIGIKKTRKDKPLPTDLFSPADSGCLRRFFSFRPFLVSAGIGSNPAL